MSSSKLSKLKAGCLEDKSFSISMGQIFRFALSSCLVVEKSPADASKIGKEKTLKVKENRNTDKNEGNFI